MCRQCMAHLYSASLKVWPTPYPVRNDAVISNGRGWRPANGGICNCVSDLTGLAAVGSDPPQAWPPTWSALRGHDQGLVAVDRHGLTWPQHRSPTVAAIQPSGAAAEARQPVRGAAAASYPATLCGTGSQPSPVSGGTASTTAWLGPGMTHWPQDHRSPGSAAACPSAGGAGVNASRATSSPNSNSSQIDTASITWEGTSGGVKMAPMTNAPTMT